MGDAEEEEEEEEEELCFVFHLRSREPWPKQPQKSRDPTMKH